MGTEAIFNDVKRHEEESLVIFLGPELRERTTQITDLFVTNTEYVTAPTNEDCLRRISEASERLCTVVCKIEPEVQPDLLQNPISKISAACHMRDLPLPSFIACLEESHADLLRFVVRLRPQDVLLLPCA